MKEWSCHHLFEGGESLDIIRMELLSLLPRACMCVWMCWSFWPFVCSGQQSFIFYQQGLMGMYFILWVIISQPLFSCSDCSSLAVGALVAALSPFRLPFSFLKVQFPVFGHSSKFVMWSSAVFWQFICSGAWKTPHFLLSCVASGEKHARVQMGELCKWVFLFELLHDCVFCFVKIHVDVTWHVFPVIKPLWKIVIYFFTSWR